MPNGTTTPPQPQIVELHAHPVRTLLLWVSGLFLVAVLAAVAFLGLTKPGNAIANSVASQLQPARVAQAETRATDAENALVEANTRAGNAEAEVKKLTDNPIVRTEVFTKEVPVEKVVEKIVEIKVPVDKIVEKVVEVTNPTTPTLVSTCRHIQWFTDAHEGALNTTTDVAGLLAKLDRDFQLTEGGQWSNAGFTVPANTVFWTDLLNHEIPPQVARIRTQGNWGIYKTSAGYTIPSPTGGGRFLKVCEDTASLLAASQVGKVSTTVPVKPADKPAICITADEVSGILKAIDPMVAYNAFFEGKGYQFGKGLNAGDKVGAGFYLGTFPKDAVPSTVTSLANGFLWRVNAETVVQGGRVMTECK